MKKYLILALIFTIALFAYAATTKPYTQEVRLDTEALPDVTNGATATSPLYTVSAYNTANPLEIISTTTHAPAQIRMARIGNGTTVPYFVAVYIQLANFSRQWNALETIHFIVTHIASGEVATWDWIIPDQTSVAVTIRYPNHEIIPPYSPQGFSLEVTSNYAGATIYKDGDPTGEVTPFTFDPAEAGTYTVMLDGVTGWNPVNYVYAAEEDFSVHFVGTKIPGAALNPIPANGATLTWVWDQVDQPVVLSWDAVLGVTGYKLFWNGAVNPEMLVDPTWTTPAIGAGVYDWQVIPYITDPAKGTTRNLAPVKAKIGDRNASSVKGDAVDCPVWTFTVELEDEPVEPDVPAGEETVIPGGGTATIEADEDLDFVPGIDETTPVVIALPNFANLVNPVVIGLTGTGTDVTISIAIDTPGVWFGVIYHGGTWHTGTPFPLIVPPAGTITFSGVDFTAKEDVIIVLSEDEDPTLPVELSSFDAVLTATNLVTLTWVSESETEMIGYRVYRNESNEYNTALLISGMYQAYNTSTQQTYKHEDSEVEVGHTYYYWLESVDYNASHIHGPVSVTVTNDTPEIPVYIAKLANAYPNPFRMGSQQARIDVTVKNGENGSVTVYNILGQAVKTFKVTEGDNILRWDGRDNKGAACGSGIYFYKLSTPSLNQTKKLVIMK